MASDDLGGSCSANAECILKKGQETLGDGFVRLDCTETTCTCALELLSPLAVPSTSSIALPAPCTTASQALELIVEHCMSGMTVVSRQ